MNFYIFFDIYRLFLYQSKISMKFSTYTHITDINLSFNFLLLAHIKKLKIKSDFPFSSIFPKFFSNKLFKLTPLILKKNYLASNLKKKILKKLFYFKE